MNWEWVGLMVGLYVAIWLFTSNPPRSFWSVFGLVFIVMFAVRLTVMAVMS